MCLHSVDKITKTATIGYKAYSKREDGSLFGGNYGKAYKGKNRWLKSTDKILKGWSITPYRSGFHVFKTIRGAQKWYVRDKIICKVEIDPSSIVASGKQSGCNVIVAQRIKILEEVL